MARKSPARSPMTSSPTPILPPGTDPAEVFPHLKRQREAAEDAAFAAWIAASQRVLTMLRAEVDELKAAQARRRLEEAKYIPGQPRVPAGNPRGGQWTDRSGGQGSGTSLAQPMGNVELGDVSESSELGDLFQIKPDEAPVIGEQVAGERQRGYPADLLEERELGGHAIEGHVRKSEEALSARAQREALSAEKDGPGEGFRVGSFSSLEAANKLVNSTLDKNRDKIDLVTSGQSSRETLRAEYPTITGKEAYVRNANSQAVIRDTYGVVVVIVPDGRVQKGYRVDTAFPVNFGR